MGGTTGDDIATHGVNLHRLVGERGEVVIPFVARLVQLGGPDHRSRTHPGVGFKFRHEKAAPAERERGSDNGDYRKQLTHVNTNHTIECN